MPHAIHITRRALRELDEAFGWLAQRSRPAALCWQQLLAKALSSLQNDPERCALAPECEWYPGELRQLLHGKRRGVYRILFEIRGNTVFILRIRHSAQALLEPGDL